jgi:uncharacterized protein (DUF1015 family)
MAKIKPFRALRPTGMYVSEIAAPPYDVVSTEEARQIVQKRPHSFLRITRAEIEFPPDANAYNEEIYLRGKHNLQMYEREGMIKRDPKPCFYIYRQQMNQHIQTGIVAGASCAEYETNEIRKHEHTRPTKEIDRARHIEILEAQAGPVWLAYRASADLNQHIDRITAQTPVFQITADDGIIHTGWVVDQDADIALIQHYFAERIPLLYIADGHHRSAAACRVAKIWREKRQADPTHPSQFFLSVIYPHDQLQILAYNRYVRDLNGLQPEQLLQRIAEHFEIHPISELQLPSPPHLHQFDLYLAGQWHRLNARPEIFDPNDPIDSLDVQILQKHLLDPILGIHDPRTDERIDFIGGIRGHKELERRVQEGGGLAIACYPTSIEQLFHVADANQVMPPKSTWFEPKLRSGLFTYLLQP